MSEQDEMQPPPEPAHPAPPPPYVVGAVLCDQVIRSVDGTFTPVRIVDRFFIDPKNLEGLPEGKELGAQIHVYLNIKSAPPGDRGPLRMDVVTPAGRRLPVSEPTEVNLEGDLSGAQASGPATLPTTQEGVYWLEVVWGDRVLVRSPYSVVHGQMPGGQE